MNHMVDELTATLTRVLIKTKPSRDEMALLLKGVRKMRRGLTEEAYREFSGRARLLVDIEVKWRERRDWEREMATAWGPYAN